MADFSNLQGYNVKDAYARERIEFLENNHVVNSKNDLANLVDAVGDITLVLNVGSVNNVSVERVAEHGGTPLFFSVGDKNYKFKVDNFFNVGLLGAKDGISTQLQSVLDSGYSLFFPKGLYSFGEINVPSGTSIVGDDCGIVPNVSTYLFRLNGDNILIENISMITNENTRNCIAILSDVGANFIKLKNLKIENFRRAFSTLVGTIWSVFEKCDFIGCFDTALYVSGAKQFFNCNTFYSCNFRNNVNYGIYVDCSPGYDFTNNFIGCNIELNNQDRFGEVSTSKCAVYANASLNFIGCYFEANGVEEDDKAIIAYKQTTFEGCNFTLEKNIASVHTLSTFVNCRAYETSGSILNGNVSACAVLVGCNFTTNNANSIDVTNNKFKYQDVSSYTLDCSKRVIRMRHNVFSELINQSSGQIITIYNNSYPLTINSDLMLNGNAVSLAVGEAKSFTVIEDKLVEI